MRRDRALETDPAGERCLEIGTALREARRWLREDIVRGQYLRDHVLPGLLERLDDEDLRLLCERAADDYAQRFTDRTPFASPVHRAPCIATALAYPLPSDQEPGRWTG